MAASLGLAPSSLATGPSALFENSKGNGAFGQSEGISFFAGNSFQGVSLRGQDKGLSWNRRDDFSGRQVAVLRSPSTSSSFELRASSLSTTPNIISSLATDEEQLVPLDPDFYRMGFVRDVRAYGVEFKEGSKGVGVYFTSDIPFVKVPLTVLEIPAELMVTVSKDPPWMFRPDFLPMGDPLFPVIDSTVAETDWDIRMACMLLLGVYQEDNFWHYYSDFLPPLEECTSLLLATKEELSELQDSYLEQYMAGQQTRLEEFWAKHWDSPNVPLKLQRICSGKEQFKWAVAQTWSRTRLIHCIFSALRQDTHVMCPYADMLNHSYNPNCAFRWRKHDQMLEVYIMAGQSIRAGEEPNDVLMRTFGFSLRDNEWEGVVFSGNAKIHRDSFLSTFNILGTFDCYYLKSGGFQKDSEFGDGSIIAAARTLPMWHEGDKPALPSEEIAAAAEIRRECEAMLKEFPTTVEEDKALLERRRKNKSDCWRSALKYRIHRKEFIKKIMRALEVYCQSFWY